MSNLPWRDLTWQSIQTPWDVIIIGGGIVGAGVFRESVRAGLKTLLLEAHDFSSGTSSRSSKMVHGGLRYLKNGQIKLTLDSVRERQRLINEAVGLVDPLEFFLVSYEKDKIPGWMFGLGLIIYDTLALKWDHNRYPVQKIQEICPNVKAENLTGAFSYYDAQTDDARLVLRIIREAQLAGGTALNYAKVEGLLRNQNGKVAGVQLHDLANNRSAEIKASVVINATGAWADDLRAHVDKPPRLRQLRGSHLVFPAQKFPVHDVISFLHPIDQRPVFAFAWEGATLVGTTDVDHQEPMLTDPCISSAESEYLMAIVDQIFGCLGLQKQDVISTMAGIRSVLDTGKADPSKESRDEILWNEDGLITITGGKLTMFRHMANTTLNFVRKQLPRPIKINRKAWSFDPLQNETMHNLVTRTDLSPQQKQRLFGRYGADAPGFLQNATEQELEPVHNLPTLWGEIRWAAQVEQVVHLEDLLLRRTRLGNLLPNGGLDDMQTIRSLTQSVLGWDEITWQNEVDLYRSLWQQAYAPPKG
jgi:glycerol-3-phosphate dehydrogenase